MGEDHTELNDWKINQIMRSQEELKSEISGLNHSIEDIKRELIVQKTVGMKDLEASRESRTSQGKRIGALEADMVDLKGIKKVLLVVGGIASASFVTAIKVLLGSL